MKYHEAANLFPLLEGDEFEQFVADIKAHGQQQAITLYHGEILDGRNRFRACQRLGIEPNYAYRDDIADPIAYVISLNLKRRQMTPTQCAAAAMAAHGLYEQQAQLRKKLGMAKTNAMLGRNSDVETMSQQVGSSSETGKSSAAVGKLFGISHTTVERAAAVQREAPDLFEQMKSGEVTVTAAYKQVQERRGRVKRETEPSHTAIEEVQRGESEEMAAAKRHIPPVARPARPERTADTETVVQTLRAVREQVLTTDARSIADQLNEREMAQAETVYRDLHGWFSRLMTALADRRRREATRTATGSDPARCG